MKTYGQYPDLHLNEPTGSLPGWFDHCEIQDWDENYCGGEVSVKNQDGTVIWVCDQCGAEFDRYELSQLRKERDVRY